MLKFRYVAYDTHGRKESGYIEAENRPAAVAILKGRGLQPTVLHGPLGRQPGAGRFNISRVRIKALSAYTRKFSQLYKAGIGIDEVFDILSEEEDHRVLRDISKKLTADIRDGMTLESALGKYPSVFPPLYIALFKAGMESGNLDEVADRLATLYEQESALRIQMASKLVYPAVMLVVGLGFAYLLLRLGWLHPDVVRGLVIFWGIVLAVIIFFSTPVGYPLLRSILRHLPYIGPLMLKTNMSRFCRILALMYGSGVPLLEALDHTEKTLQDPRLTKSLGHIKTMINEGEDLASAMKRAGMIPARVISMVAVGERSGDVEEVLKKMSAYYDVEIEHQHQVLGVVAYFAAYMLMAITIGIIVISFWAGYYGRITSMME